MYTQAQIQQYEKQTEELLKNSELSNVKETSIITLAIHLQELINYHDWRYYVLAEPVIKDIDYDYLFDTLKAIELKYPETVNSNSPTQRVARGLSEDFPNVNHLVSMLSLSKAYKDEDLLDWDNSVKKLAQSEQLTYIVEPKFDGSSIGLIYENDLLVRGATRGNGITGDDITNNIKTLASIPLSAKFSEHGIQRVELRGEVLIHKEKFERLNKGRAEKGEKLFSNARNTASGGLRQKDSSKLAERKLEAFVYQLSIAFDETEKDLMGSDFNKHNKNIKLLYSLGFKTPFSVHEEAHICQNIEEVIAYCETWRIKRDDYPYEIDGMVIKINDVRLQEICGSTSHHPRWAVALKFDARQAETVLENVDFQIGRTGAITPVAKLKTVNLAGANISNASLHNEDFIAEKDVRIGDTVLVERAGDVIPYIVKVMTEKRMGTEKVIEFPKNCPSCEQPLVKSEEESIWRCINFHCPAQVEQRLIHYVSKGAMDIRGLGKDIVKRFLKEKFITNIPDIYQLDYEKISTLEGWGKKSVENLKTSVENSKKQPLYRLLIGLGIREVGTTTAKTLVEAINSIQDLSEWTAESLAELPDIGPKVAANIVAFFSDEKNQKLLKELEKAGVNMVKIKSVAITQKNDSLAGLSFLFTGSLQNFTRTDAKKMVEERGGKVLNSVSKKLTYLVTGEKPGSKLKKAEKIDTIKVIDEAAFLGLIK